MVNEAVKWTLLILGAVMVIQWLIIWWKQRQFFSFFKNQVSLYMVFGSLGSGKSLLFSWLVNRLDNTYTNFWHKKKGNKILSLDFMDVRGKYKIPETPANYFFDEVNLTFRGVEYKRNQKECSGIEDFCVLARHFDKKVGFAVQRDSQLWAALREICNIYIKVKGIYTPLFLPWCSVLRIEVYEDLKLSQEWSSNMAPYQKGGFFSMFSGNDYDQAKKRLNIKEFKIFLKNKDFKNYDTKFFKALLPLLNKNRVEANIPPNQIPVPKALRDVIKDEFFIIEENPQSPTLWQKIRNYFTFKTNGSCKAASPSKDKEKEIKPQ
ncbi:MAG: hypothetical protein GBAus27B_000512 [Mycoplasmataceae bacterium]|nr:MAG: hypothetical protein GBAus27B_000512 [Mycoplasmataceae bacterium]